MTMNFFDAVKNRRTYYSISKKSPVSDERIREIVEQAVKHCPSAFNSQSGVPCCFSGRRATRSGVL
ncbi:MAG TPA: hypothetical protein PK442_02495 [Synergistales bacterium]|nr:hypothetical protein [Synergistales bacterium]